MALLVVKFIILLLTVASIPTWGYNMRYGIPDEANFLETEEYKTDLADRGVHLSNFHHCTMVNNVIESNQQIPRFLNNVTCLSWDGPEIDPMTLNLDTMEDDHCYASKACTTVTENKSVFVQRRVKDLIESNVESCWLPKTITVGIGCKCAIVFSKTT